MYRYELERGSKKHLCPQCGKKTFVRVVDTATGSYLLETVGRCDRESRCGYQYTWKEYLTDHADVYTSRKSSGNVRKIKATGSNSLNAVGPQMAMSKNGPYDLLCKWPSHRTPDYLSMSHLVNTLDHYNENTLVQFLFRLFPDDRDAISHAVSDYKIGTFEGWTSFPVISTQGRFCKAKLMKFDPISGKRFKDANGKSVISSLQSKLKKAGKLNEDFEADKEVFFGEHLLAKYPDQPIAIVESEKTAILASICKGAFPVDMAWLATGSKQWLKPHRIAKLGRTRTIILYPDADGFELWKRIASEASRLGSNVQVSSLIERLALSGQKANQADLADYLIAEQQKRNDPVRRERFRRIIENQVVWLMNDQGKTEVQAEMEIISSGFYTRAVKRAVDGDLGLTLAPA